MALKISLRKQFLSERKNSKNRVTIGFTGIADLRSFIGLEYIKGMMKAASDYDINFINMGGAVKYSLFDDINFISHYTKKFKFMREPFVDGLVTWASSLWEFMDEKSMIKLFSDLQPLPMVDIGHVDIPGVAMLKIDSPAAIRQIMAHLINVHNYKKFAFIGADVSAPHQRRLLVYQHELKKYGISEIPNSVYMAKSLSPNHIAEVIDSLCKNHTLDHKKEIEAIVTTTDIIAAEVIEQLSRRGISVPRDVAVTGFNNWYEGITARSPLTTIDLAYFKRGYAAVEMLIDRIIQPNEKVKTTYFPPTLIVRQSCDCFEQSVVNSFASKKILSVMKEAPDEREEFSSNLESEDALRSQLVLGTRLIFPYLADERIENLIEAFFSDVYDSDFSLNESQSRTLRWFRNVMQDFRKSKEFDSDHFQDAVSSLRSLFLPVLKNEKSEVIFSVENIFHQMRTLISVFQKYESLADRENPYRLNNLAEQSMSFVSVQSMEQIYEILRQNLSELDIPGMILALSETMSFSFPSPNIEFVFPETSPETRELLHKHITEPHLFPKNLFPTDKRYSVMLEVLHHGEQYFGYAFFEMKKINIATYDVLRMLLSNALYTVYKKEGRIKNSSVSVSESQIQDLVKNDENSETRGKLGRARITVEKITDYLTARTNEMTDIEKMAATLMVSRSFLSKKCKELTGLSVQSLHEKLKIEQAKNMLALGSFELSEIASKLGFKNQNYFSNVFKKNTGLSPKNWVKKTL